MSVAPTEAPVSAFDDPRDVGGGLVVNLNFAEQGPSQARKVVDVTPTTSAPTSQQES